MLTPPTLVLDFDGSLGGLSGVERIPLQHWQERIRFGCAWSHWRALEQCLAENMPHQHASVCMGSGDYHHVTHLLIKRLQASETIDVLVFDNHPDNMRFPLGIHCGSWVKHVAALPGVGTVHVVGITSGDVGWAHAWENHLRPLYAGRVCYWTLNVQTRWASRLGLGHAVRSFPDRATLLAELQHTILSSQKPWYLSIDKDVLAPEEAHTNWDQGQFTVADLLTTIRHLKGRMIASDITGEVSIHHYQARWKRMLSALDEQPAIDPVQLGLWQARQNEVNEILLAHIRASA